MSSNSEKVSRPRSLLIIALLYFITGAMLLSYFIITLLSYFTQSSYLPFHLALISALNMFSSYSIIRARRWTIYVVTLTSLVGIIFGLITLAAISSPFSPDVISILILLGLGAYVPFLLISLILVALNRSKFSK